MLEHGNQQSQTIFKMLCLTVSRHNVKLNPRWRRPSRQYFVFDLRVQLQHCTYQRKTLLFALIKVSTFICKREISGLSSPLRYVYTLRLVGSISYLGVHVNFFYSRYNSVILRL